MSDFTGGFWSVFIAVVTLASIAACGVLLYAFSGRQVATDPENTGHVWDEDLAENNNPLPRWWVWLFVITIVYSLGYLWIYPGLGAWSGATKWTSTREYSDEMAEAEDRYAPRFARYSATSLEALSADPEAHAVGERLFLNFCSQCHASDARGGKGYPNLTDGDWLYGGDAKVIEASILDGRNGVMPALGAALGVDGTRDVANYVRSLSGLSHEASRAGRGRASFGTYCAACHGAEGLGNPAMGAPNLADAVWLFGSTEATVIETITHGRSSTMPAHRALLGEARVHVLAAYVYGLSHAAAARKVAATK